MFVSHATFRKARVTYFAYISVERFERCRCEEEHARIVLLAMKIREFQSNLSLARPT